MPQYTISGTIQPGENIDLEGLRIQAFDRDLPSLERRSEFFPSLLGETLTDAEGRFTIPYTLEQFYSGEGVPPVVRRRKDQYADISFQITDRTGQELLIKSIVALDRSFDADAIIFNAPPELEVRIFIDVLPATADSEFEQHMASIAPVLENLYMADLTDADMRFLFHELGIEERDQPKQRIEWLRRSALLAAQTGVPVEAFYGWGRTDLPTSIVELSAMPMQELPAVLKKLTTLPATELQNALRKAVEEKFIPVGFRDRIAEIVRQLKRQDQLVQPITAQLQDAESKFALAGYTVTTFDISEEEQHLGLDITDSEGKFSFDLYVPRNLAPDAPVRRFVFRVTTPEQVALFVSDAVEIMPGQLPDLLVVPIKIPKPPVPDLQTLRQNGHIDLPADLLTHLQEIGIHTLSDIRRKGGVGQLNNLPPANSAALRKLESLADLDRISPDISISKALSEKYHSVLAIADTPVSEFVNQVSNGAIGLGQPKAKELHLMARVQTNLLNNLLSGIAVNQANGFKTMEAAGEIPEKLVTHKCGCSDCEAAVGPAAYLAALLDYTLKHVQNGGLKIDIPFLETTFHQAFGQLSTDCEAVEKQVRQVRLCIEALRSYLGNRPLADGVKETALAKAEGAYRFAAYSLLLSKLGTTYEEIRRARSETPESRKAVAERMGIQLTEPRPADPPGDELDRLFLDPGVATTQPHALTEQVLETLFGIADTSRDPLSEGGKYGDDQSQITRWNLDHLQWGINTDRDGKIYINLTKNAVTNVVWIELFKDAARTSLVAAGNMPVDTGTVKLVPENNSGLSGAVDIAWTADTGTVSIAAIPSVLSWQLKCLRTVWAKQDAPADLYSSGPSQLPLIDPDIIGPDDFRSPVKKPVGQPDKAYDLWLERRLWIDTLLQELQADREANDLTFILKQLLGNPLPDLDAWLHTLTKGTAAQDIDKVKDLIAKQGLTVESFSRLMEIRAKEQLAAINADNEAVSEKEWEEVYAILAQAQKVRKYSDWRAKEQLAAVRLGMEEFWIALQEPANLPPWLASPEARQLWQQALRNRSGQPVIDPDGIGADDIRHLAAGDPAFDTWKKRADELAAMRKQLKDTREAAASALNGLDTIIQEALGLKAGDLEAIDKTRQGGQPIEKRLNQLQLSMGPFTFLVRIRDLVQNNQPVVDQEWDTVYKTLALAIKQRRYAAWREEEQQQAIGISPDFFKLTTTLTTPLPGLDPGTPLWLSAWSLRRDWQDTLQSRMDQEQTVISNLLNVVSAVEEATLPALRDALVQATDAVGNDANEKAKWITERLLIDAKAGGCQVATRVAQGIETLQTLIFTLRSGQFKFLSALPLTIEAATFDEEWKWIGSYATWRAAMFVYLYCENTLHPALLKYQSPALAALIRNTRTVRPDPNTACREAYAYAAYFQDVCSLEIEATCQASTHIYAGDGCNRHYETAQSMFYMFGRATSGKMYWSAYDAGGSSGGYNQTFWNEVPGFTNTEVVRIIGAIPYRRRIARRDNLVFPETLSSYIYLFCIVSQAEKQTLKLARLNLDDFGIWDDIVSDLPVPPLNLSVAEIVPVQSQSEFYRPALVFHEPNYYKMYYIHLSSEGKGWEQSNVDWPSVFYQFQYFGSITPANYPVKIEAVLRGNNNQLWIATTEADGPKLNLIGLKAGDRPSVSRAWYYEKGVFLGVLPGPLTDPLSSIQIGFQESIVYFFWRDAAGTYYRKFTDGDIAANLMRNTIADLIRIPPHSGTGTASQQMFAYKRNRNAKAFYMYRYAESGDQLVGSLTYRALPRVLSPLNIPRYLSGAQLQQRRQEIINAFALNADATSSVLSYLHEAFYFVPMQIAMALQSAGHYLAALDWFRTVYDYEAQLGTPNQRNIYYGLVLDAQLPDIPVYQQTEGWLLDPLNPHLIAATRRYAYTRFTIMMLVQCLLDYADAEFTRETKESLAIARVLYLTALDLLNLPEMQQRLDVCDDLVAELKIEPGKDIPPEVPAIVGELREELSRTTFKFPYVQDAVKEIKTLLQANASWAAKLAEAKAVVKEVVMKAPVAPLAGDIIADQPQVLAKQYTTLLTQPDIDSMLQEVGKAAVINLGTNQILNAPPPVISPSLQFCIPPNPMLKILALRATLNLSKLRSCRNIAGIKRELDVYAAPTDTSTGMPVVGAGGQLLLPGVNTIKPTLYRYATLIERAKQLVQLAAQIELPMLAALEKRDAEAYNLLKARQDLGLAQASIQLQNLRIKEATDSVTLAKLQQDRSQIQVDTYKEWINAGYLQSEVDYLNALEYLGDARRKLAGFATQQSVLGGMSTDFVQSFAHIFNTWVMVFANPQKIVEINNEIASQRYSFIANYERRKQEWELQQALAEQDVVIGSQQITLANDHVDIVKQEKTIAELQTTNAKDTIEFLTTKFTNVNLYDWMSSILEGVYRFFLQQATAMAKLAQSQLAFERQEVAPAYIQADYWVATDGTVTGTTHEKPTDRKGLTGSSRLLQDIYQLDQYAFTTNRRKLQLVKTFSLALLAPLEFQRFREEGILRFATPMELFDRSFPGQYLRLIKRIRTSVVALIPPAQGISATLSNPGLSRVVIGPDIFQTIPVRRDPELIALSSPVNATGLFELEAQQTDMLYPFEGNGVDTTWEFRMPKAANLFDYRTIADVLITMEYTALHNYDYEQQVKQLLNPRISGDQTFSFRNQFADQWYDLHNPDQTKQPMSISFQTLQQDFPPNVENLTIQQVLLYFAGTSGIHQQLPLTELKFTEQGSVGAARGTATPVEGVISTKRGNAGPWMSMIGKSPAGNWQLTLPNTEQVKKLFADEKIEDILLVITYAGHAPARP